MMAAYLLVMAGGAVGSLARYLAAMAVATRYPGQFPMGTLLVNVSGCFLIGVIMPVLAQKPAPSPNWRLLLVVGFLGGYTTFSSFAYETYSAMRGGSPWTGFLNIAGSVVLGCVAVWLGAICMGFRYR